MNLAATRCDPSGQQVHRKKLWHIAQAKQTMFAQRCSNMNFQTAIKIQGFMDPPMANLFLIGLAPKIRNTKDGDILAFSRHFSPLQLPLFYGGFLGHKTATLYYTQVETSMAWHLFIFGGKNQSIFDITIGVVNFKSRHKPSLSSQVSTSTFGQPARCHSDERTGPALVAPPPKPPLNPGLQSQRPGVSSLILPSQIKETTHQVNWQLFFLLVNLDLWSFSVFLCFFFKLKIEDMDELVFNPFLNFFKPLLPSETVIHSIYIHNKQVTTQLPFSIFLGHGILRIPCSPPFYLKALPSSRAEERSLKAPMQDLCSDGKLPGRQTGRLDQANLNSSGKPYGWTSNDKDQNDYEESYWNHVPYPS